MRYEYKIGILHIKSEVIDFIHSPLQVAEKVKVGLDVGVGFAARNCYGSGV